MPPATAAQTLAQELFQALEDNFPRTDETNYGAYTANASPLPPYNPSPDTTPTYNSNQNIPPQPVAPQPAEVYNFFSFFC